MSGSFDNGDSTTTNLYIGNVNPSVVESDLCDVFASFGPLASVKIMWPRTDEERARHRNSGFVAFMNREDADRALKSLNGINLKGYDIKLGWAKAVPIPPNPIVPFNPKRLQNFTSNLLSPDLTTKIESSRPISVDIIKPRRGLNENERQQLDRLLTDLDISRKSIGASMLFCINHSDSASDIVNMIHESLIPKPCTQCVPFKQKLGKLFLVSDILHNCSAQVTNASFYHGGFKAKLIEIFRLIRDDLISIKDSLNLDKFKRKIFTVLKAWKEWSLYEDKFLIKLSDIILGLENPTEEMGGDNDGDDSLDGVPITDELLIECLEAKGLSLEWYESRYKP